MEDPSAVLVQGTGRSDVDGTYVPIHRKFHGEHVFRKPGTSFTVLRRGEGGWGLAKFARGGIDTLRWSPKSSDLYSVSSEISGLDGQPPELGWEAKDADGPAPSVITWKNWRRISRLRCELPSITSPRSGRLLSASASAPSFQLPLQLSSPDPDPAPPPATTTTAAAGWWPEAVNKPGSRQRTLETCLLSLGSSPDIPDGHSRHLFVFRVVLPRPTSAIELGYRWNIEAHTKHGCRVIDRVDQSSPLGRWNTWQIVRGRPLLQVQAGDQLLKVNGKWSFSEVEVNQEDRVEECEESGAPLARPCADLLEFGRWCIRANAPQPPEVDLWQKGAGIRISWGKCLQLPWITVKSGDVMAWSVAIFDREREQWYSVDGTSGNAEKLRLGKEFNAFEPNVTSVVVYNGLARGRNYMASVALLTEHGWSPFSETSVAVGTTMTIHGSRSKARLESLSSMTRHGTGSMSSASTPKDKPRVQFKPEKILKRPAMLRRTFSDRNGTTPFLLPSKIVPGQTAPIELEPGPRSLLARPRLMQLRFSMRGSEVAEDVTTKPMSRRGLFVEDVQRASIAAPEQAGTSLQNSFGWCGMVGAAASEAFDIHGQHVVPSLRPGDTIVMLNGLSVPKEMLEEIQRRPDKLVLLVCRTVGTGSGHSGAQQNPELCRQLFEIDGRFDGQLTSLAEDINSNDLLPEREGLVWTRMVLQNDQDLRRALDLFEKTVEEGSVLEHATPEEKAARYGVGLLHEAQKRLHMIENRRRLEAGLRHGRTKEELQYQTTISLRTAAADPTEDPGPLQFAIDNFCNRCLQQTKSKLVDDMLDRARSLQKLWSHRTSCWMLRSKLERAVAQSLAWEAARRQKGLWPYVPPSYEAAPPPPFLKILIKEASAHTVELGYLYEEAAAVHSRHEWALAYRPPKSDAFRADKMDGPLRSLRLGELEGWWTRPEESSPQEGK